MITAKRKLPWQQNSRVLRVFWMGGFALLSKGGQIQGQIQ